ncbi:MAG: acylphosphatase [Bacteroidales bacterium]|nr:acylphosphatase [Bacteroidales bacterium]
MISLQISLSGKIQKTGFPFYVKQFAILNNIRGSVRILDESHIVIEAEGKETGLNKFIEFCRVGPLGSSVDGVSISKNRIRHFNSFVIIE